MDLRACRLPSVAEATDYHIADQRFGSEKWGYISLAFQESAQQIVGAELLIVALIENQFAYHQFGNWW